MSHGKEQAQAQYEHICHAVQRIEDDRSGRAVDSIREEPLSIMVACGWTEPGNPLEPDEYEILLCTGGPAVRIIGKLDAHKEPHSALLQFQDWFTPWEEYTEANEEVLKKYASCFWYGE